MLFAVLGVMLVLGVFIDRRHILLICATFSEM